MSASGDQSAGERRSTASRAPEQRARELAAGLRAESGGAVDLRDRLSALGALLGRAYRRIHRSDDTASSHPRLVEWLLDNEYLVRRALRQVRESVPPAFERDLPRLSSGPGEGRPRVEAVARELLLVGQYHLEEDLLVRFVDAFQEESPLTTGELWALPAFLRLAALERAAAVTADVVGLERTPVAPDTRAEEIAAPTAAREVGRCVESLRWLDEADWRPHFERLSRVERRLRRDPSGHYARMDFQSRDRYRKAVEDVASWSGVPEPDVAAVALRMADAAGAEADPTHRHVGHYLVGEGRRSLEARTGARPPLRVRIRRWGIRHARPLFFSGIAGIAAALLALLVQVLPPGAPTLLLGLAAAAPATTVAASVVRWVVSHTAPTRSLPKLELDDVPGRYRTAVVVPCLLGSEDEVDDMLEKLEVLYRGNRGGGAMTFGLLSDFTDAPRKEMPGDDRLLERARRGIEELNLRCGGPERRPFFLLHRERLWNPGEDCWMGWERKRGKLEEFNRLVLGEGETSHTFSAGNVEHLSDVRFALTVDEDTRVPPGEAVRLVGTMAHPLNRPELDGDGQLRSGYSILQPRLQSAPPPEGFTHFARIQEGNTGLDLYSHAVSDVYQDLFGEGIFVGKGIYDVASFHRTTAGRVPENALLSHDIFEGICGRAGLVSDVVLLEDYPETVPAYLRRLHRWIRGDWQWLPWLLPRVPTPDGREPNPFSVLDLWKIADNLVRSLLPPSLVVMAAAGWLSGTLSPWLWTGIVAAVPGVPIVLGAAEVAARRLFRPESGGDRREQQPTVRSRLKRIDSVARLQAERWLVSTALLLSESVVAADAVARTLVRLTITRRHLLEWTTAAQAGRRAADRALDVWREMRTTVVVSAGLSGLLAVLRPAALPAAAPLLGAWLLSPQVSHLLGRRRRRSAEEVDAEDRRFLREVALRTWMFFERFTTSEEHWLPPDHHREAGGGQTARRTSPTNIGLGLTANLAAWDLGFVGPLYLEAALRNTLEGMERLERYRGHFLNWYSTRDLTSLEPRYVSTVDSGNIAAALVVVAEGARTVPEKPVLRARTAETVADVLRILADSLDELEVGDAADEKRRLLETIRTVRSRARGLDDDPVSAGRALEALATDELPALDRELMGLFDRLGESPVGDEVRRDLRRVRLWCRKLNHQVTHTLRELRTVLPWLVGGLQPPPSIAGAPEESAASAEWRSLRELLAANPALEEIPGLADRALERLRRLAEELPESAEDARRWLDELRDDVQEGGRNARRLTGDLRDVAEAAGRSAGEMDFDFLYDRTRDLFHLGFDLSAGTLDAHHYDLLASEARLASLFAVTRGDAPAGHWLHLGRPFGPDGDAPVLLSWGGSMFEYLLPAQFTRTPPDSLLERGCRQAIRAHVEHGRRHDVPWGLSEAAYRKPSDPDGYGYRAFGVPGLALRRGADDPLVVAPYASALALPFRPAEATRNLGRLADRGLLSDYGFHESLDFGPRDTAREGEPVRAYMAHHQGMTLLGIDNCLEDWPMVERFHASAGVEAAEYLLHEEAPWQIPLERPWTPPERQLPDVDRKRPASQRWSPPEEAVRPHLQLLSNGSYRVLMTARGSGGSYWRDRAVTRWEPDPTVERGGTSLYVADRQSREAWSVGGTGGEEGDGVSCEMSPHDVRFHRREGGVAAEARVTVAPEVDAEIRRVRLSNATGRTRRLAVTSYGEVSLAPPEDDLRHPAYSKLFVEAEVVEEGPVLLFRRRPRESGTAPAWVSHSVVGASSGGGGGTLRWETDRERFLGRNAGGAIPDGALDPPIGRRGEGSPETLDPIFSLSAELELGPFESRSLAFVTGAADSRTGAVDLQARFDSLARVDVAFEDAEAAASERMSRHGLAHGAGRHSQELLSALFHPTPELDGRGAVDAASDGSRSDLWAHGVSGDDPILLVRVESSEETAFVDGLLRLHRQWSELGVPVDLVVLHAEPPGYVQRVRDRVESLLERLGPGPGIGEDGGVHLVSEAGCEPARLAALLRAAAVVLDAGGATLDEQLSPVRRDPDRLPDFAPAPSDEHGSAGETPPLPDPEGLEHENGFGGFTGDGEYVVVREPDRPTPAPWVNVISNEEFGFLASEASLGCTWSLNSGERRLTPWRNDPLLDRPSEVLYLRDEETAEVWSATPLPAGGDRPYLVRHGTGRTSYRHHRKGLIQELEVAASPDDPVKIATLEIENRGERPRRITATYYAEWVLGTRRAESLGWVAPDYDSERDALLARNPGDPVHGSRVAFLTADRPPHGITGDRTEFVGRAGGLARPDGLGRIGLSDRVPRDGDPCAAYQVHLELEPGERTSVHFVLGDGRDRGHALQLASTYSSPEAAGEEVRRQEVAWEDRLGGLTVRTPDEEGLDRLVNRWLPYQVLSSRLWARTAAYQSSGAFGFRDQLQDVLALLHVDPDLAREHLLRAAGRQFESGDVLHWWQPGGTRGVRTRCSDDLLWLPYATARYVAFTGDRSVLDEEIPFLEGPGLGPGETERYAEWRRGEESATLFAHCVRALERGHTSGPHGLPLIGTGDWNDGMNRVGVEGRGESVWLGWFLCRVLRDVAELAEARGEDERADALRKRSDGLAERVEEAGWDGSWYRRAYYDDGTPLGSAANREARIDGISQAWAVLSGAAREDRATRAMDSVDEHLMRVDDHLVLLLTPPFRDTTKDPGYIRAYPPGVRENGGQYTHAAAWVGWAFADLGDAERAREVLRWLNPVARAGSPDGARRYAVEPYVQCADVYGEEPFTGRGGWTWYTGSAAWTYRFAVERVLGLRRRGDRVRLDPCPPPEWDGWSMRLRERDTEWRIRVRVLEDAEPGVQSLELDGSELERDAFPLRHDGGEHEVVARVGRPEPPDPGD